MGDCAIGSIWTVAGIDGGMAVVLAGPFASARAAAEYVVAPLYTGTESGFRWTDEDVRLEQSETAMAGVAYAAIWNVRPILESDLVLETGFLPDAVVSDVRDVYWASLNERRITGRRIGQPITSRRQDVADFQARELQRWAIASGRALEQRAQARVPSAGILEQVRFSTLAAEHSVVVSGDSLARVLQADPRCVVDEIVFGEASVSQWLASSAGGLSGSSIPTAEFVLNPVAEFHGRVNTDEQPPVEGEQILRCA